MNSNSINLKVTATLYVSGLILSSFLSGCSDSKDKRTESINTSKPVEVTNSSKIEIVKNENQNEVKVAQEHVTRSKNDSFYYDYGEKSEYDQNAQPANKDASVRVRPRTNIDANMNVRSPYEEVQISMVVNKLSKKFIVRCSACHNDYANGIIGPSLIGRDSNYVYEKIQDFKTGKKSNPLMKDLINMMSDKEIREMANEIYKFNQEIKKIRNK